MMSYKLLIYYKLLSLIDRVDCRGIKLAMMNLSIPYTDNILMYVNGSSYDLFWRKKRCGLMEGWHSNDKIGFWAKENRKKILNENEKYDNVHNVSLSRVTAELL